MNHAENYCRFTGILSDFELRVGPDETWTMGRGKLFLPDPEKPRVGQTISFTSWNLDAERLADVKLGSWITIICSFSVSKSGDRSFNNFDLDCFVVIRD